MSQALDYEINLGESEILAEVEQAETESFLANYTDKMAQFLEEEE